MENRIYRVRKKFQIYLEGTEIFFPFQTYACNFLYIYYFATVFVFLISLFNEQANHVYIYKYI